MLRDRPEDLARVCALTPHSRAEHEASYDLDGTDDVERARRVWVRLTQGRAGVLRPTGWRHFQDPTGSGSSMAIYQSGYVDRMRSAAGRIANVSLECIDALDVISKYGRHAGVLLYVDPPYLGSARGWGNQYRHELRTDGEHEALAEALRACRAAVVLSGYDSPLYDGLYTDWDAVRLPASTGNGGRDRARTEVLWSNRPLGHERLDFGSSA